MTKSKMFRSGVPTDEESTTPSPRTTIVGGRPPEEDAATLPVPTGIQSLLRLAAVDINFRRELIEKRANAATAAGIELTSSEQAILTAIPASQIEQMAERMPDPPHDRRDFLRSTAATAVVLLGGAALSSCDSCSPAKTLGISPEIPPERPPPVEPMTAGIAPDIPERPEQRDTTRLGGAAPDEPPPGRPDHRDMSSDGGIAPDEPPPRPNRVPSPPGGARPDLPEEPEEKEPKRPKRPLKTRGISPR